MEVRSHCRRLHTRRNLRRIPRSRTQMTDHPHTNVDPTGDDILGINRTAAGAPKSVPETPATTPVRTLDERMRMEARLVELRREAERTGRVADAGVRPAGAPFPVADASHGYYGVPMLKQPQWKWQIPFYFFVGGAAGAASVIGTAANWTGSDEELVRDARFVAAGGAIV